LLANSNNPPPETAPAPILETRDQTRPKSVALDVSTYGVERESVYYIDLPRCRKGVSRHAAILAARSTDEYKSEH
jgi:hypothetical protein